MWQEAGFLRGIGVLLLLLAVMPAQATRIEARGLFAGQALLVIDGRQRLLKEGARSPEGVLLKKADSKIALVEMDGIEYRIPLSRSISSAFRPAERAVVRLPQGEGGHYVTPARINGLPVTVMVDTGATSVSMNQAAARSLGISLRNSRDVRIATANGVVPGHVVMLDSVAVGAVSVNLVEATVTESESPAIILLGNSFLQRVEMRREQGVLVLETAL